MLDTQRSIFKCSLLRVSAAAILGFLVVSSALSAAQRSPLALARQVQDAFVHGTPEQFNAAFPFEDGRKVVALADAARTVRIAGLANVVHQTDHHAILLISGVVRHPSSAHATIESRAFSGFYEALSTPMGWKLSRQLAIDDGNRIVSHRIEAKVHPGIALDVVDQMHIEVDGDHGFAVRLNYAAYVRRILWNGKPIHHLFGGGIFWVELPKGSSGLLSLDYSLEVEEGPDFSGPGCFLRKAGHVRDEYFWHPFFDFNSTRDRANFAITVRIPKEYEVATSVPQSEKVSGNERIVRAQSERPTFALSLFYDKEWKRSLVERNGVRLELFITDDFTPSVRELTSVFDDTFALLKKRFGEPKAGYIAVVQARARAGGGWHFNTNQAIVTGGQGGGPPFRTSGEPRAFFSHEIAHLWTRGAGPAINFLQEGWARFSESLILRSKFGTEVEGRFWDAQAHDYFSQFDGKASILDDSNNSGVAYSKGAWIFRMLQNALGEERFNTAMSRFSKESLERPRDWQELAACMSDASPPFDGAKFLLPWLQETTAPDVHVTVAGSRIVVSQRGANFALSLEIEYQAQGQKYRRNLLALTAESSLDTSEPVDNVVLDPDRKLLLRR